MTRTSYDAVGNVQKNTDPRGFSVTNTWSATRKLLTTTYPATAQGQPMITNGIELDTPTIERNMPTENDSALEQLLACERFTNRSKDRLLQTQQRNALPASWRCPGQHKNVVGSSSLSTPGSLSVIAATAQLCEF